MLIMQEQEPNSLSPLLIDRWSQSGKSVAPHRPTPEDMLAATCQTFVVTHGLSEYLRTQMLHGTG